MSALSITIGFAFWILLFTSKFSGISLMEIVNCDPNFPPVVENSDQFHIVVGFTIPLARNKEVHIKNPHNLLL